MAAEWLAILERMPRMGYLPATKLRTCAFGLATFYLGSPDFWSNLASLLGSFFGARETMGAKASLAFAFGASVTVELSAQILAKLRCNRFNSTNFAEEEDKAALALSDLIATRYALVIPVLTTTIVIIIVALHLNHPGLLGPHRSFDYRPILHVAIAVLFALLVRGCFGFVALAPFGMMDVFFRLIASCVQWIRRILWQYRGQNRRNTPDLIEGLIFLICLGILAPFAGLISATLFEYALTPDIASTAGVKIYPVSCEIQTDGSLIITSIVYNFSDHVVALPLANTIQAKIQFSSQASENQPDLQLDPKATLVEPKLSAQDILVLKVDDTALFKFRTPTGKQFSRKRSDHDRGTCSLTWPIYDDDSQPRQLIGGPSRELTNAGKS